jgi:hypothetical protein
LNYKFLVKMIKLFSLKQKKLDGESTQKSNQKCSAAQLRIQKGKKPWNNLIFETSKWNVNFHCLFSQYFTTHYGFSINRRQINDDLIVV